MSILSQGRSSGFPNQRLRYVLLSNGLDSVPSADLEWATEVDWFLVLDMGAESEVAHQGGHEVRRTAFFNFLQNNSVRQVSLLWQEGKGGGAKGAWEKPFLCIFFHAFLLGKDSVLFPLMFIGIY